MAQIAAQMYTLRDFCKTEEGFIDACRRVKRMGYDGVQLSGVIELDGKETKKILDGEGLKAVVTHISLDAMENHTEAVIERHLGMDCRYAAIGGFFPKAEDWSEKLWLKGMLVSHRPLSSLNPVWWLYWAKLSVK